MDKNNTKITVNELYRIIVILVTIVVVSVVANVGMFTTILRQDKLIDAYKTYYIASEKLYDEIEEDNEGYFDGDRGANYLKARKDIKLLNK